MSTRKLRFVTAASLFDGHDASINIMRRLLQSKGVEVIHLGHNRSAQEVVEAALAEDAHAIALSSYQGGHMEYFTYVRELLDKNGGKNVRIFGGGGGVITPPEIAELHKKGITRIYHPNDGIALGLNGIIEDMIAKCDYSTIDSVDFTSLAGKQLTAYEIAKVITYIEDNRAFPFENSAKNIPVLGITGTGGAGKSSLIDELLLRFHRYYSDKKIALVSVDPTKKKNQGALLGDRIRLGSASYDNFYVRSLATRDSSNELSPEIKKVVEFLKSQNFDLILVETSGIGQASDEITKVASKTLYVMTPEYGASTQLEKIEMLEVADFIAINKFEKPRSEDALRDVRKQYRRNRNLFANHPGSPEDQELPVYGTMASKFNDVGVNALFKDLIKAFEFSHNAELDKIPADLAPEKKLAVIPASRINYLRDIADTVRNYNQKTKESIEKLRQYEVLVEASKMISDSTTLISKKAELEKEVALELKEINEYNNVIDQYTKGEYTYVVRGKDLKVSSKYQSLSQQTISKVGFPKINYFSDKYKFIRSQNLPGFFPYASGVFPFKRADEDPKRQFAGEGGPKRTNARFHYLSKNDNAKRLSTAFDSVTLYGEDPATRPDIYGKVGESGVSICTLEDMMDLYKGFDLTSPTTSVSMTINGPAPIILAMFMNTAINSALTESEQQNKEKMVQVMQQVRGTVQADILKEDQAQNTCIFSLEFSLKMMGDVQEFFCKHKIKNYYTVSISGYHIAEAGANPITQLALTLSNGFTYVEYYLSLSLIHI